MSSVIQVDNLSKHYRLGTIGGKRLVDDVHRWWAKLRGQEDPLSKVSIHRAAVSGRSFAGPRDEAIWALRDVSFEVKQGEVLGIIGRNGAGKSTLLKILSRVTGPTSGEVRVKGRIASLLEVGTGFHPELTGRENIFLNGAILGMTKAEVRANFDEIVAFSGVEQFIDTPVKRYSSGMTVRLAFAVAAHLEPEILIVDEVLAVGDAEFQQKCMGKMQDVAKGGRTVLFVSHNLAAIETLCRIGLVLNGGKLLYEGQVKKSLAFYQSLQSQSLTMADKRGYRSGSGAARCTNVFILDDKGRNRNTIKSGDKVEVVFEVESKNIINRVLPGLNINNALGQRIATFWDGFTGSSITLRPGHNRLLLRIKRLDLIPGEYKLAALLGLEGEALDIVEDAIEIHVAAPSEWVPARFPSFDHGPLFTEFTWSTYD